MFLRTLQKARPPTWRDLVEFLWDRRGSLMILGSTFCFAFGLLCCKLGRSHGINAMWFVLGRSVWQTAWAGTLCAWYRIDPRKAVRGRFPIVLLRSSLSSFANNIVLYTQMFGSQLGFASVFFFSVPVYATIAGHYILGEPAGPLEIGSVLTGMIGVLLLAQPHELFPETKTADGDLFYTVLCFLAGSTAAFGFVTMRKLKTVNFLPIALVSGVTGIVMTAIPCMFVELPTNASPGVLLYAFGSGLLSFVELCLLNVGLQIEPAAAASVIRLFAPVLGYALGIVVLGGTDDFWGVIGVLIISITVMNMVVRRTTLKDVRVALVPSEILRNENEKIALIAADIDRSSSESNEIEMADMYDLPPTRGSYHSLEDKETELLPDYGKLLDLEVK